MSYADKKFCFNCKLDTEQLQKKEYSKIEGSSRIHLLFGLKKEKNLSNCSVCKIAQYCGRECQRQDFKNHKFFCLEVYKRHWDLGATAKKILDEKGHDVTMSVQKEFYAKNDPVFQCLKKADFGYIFTNLLMPHPLELGNPGGLCDLGQIYKTYMNSKFLAVKMLGEIARKYESHRGIQIALDAYLEAIVVLQPARLYLRALVPLFMIQLGKDDDAYNFIKFWLKNTPKGFFFKVGEDGLFPQLPFTEITMKDQDKTEDLFQVLNVGGEKPYFLYFPFYVCLAIIKKNNYDATKDKNQNQQFRNCLNYIKTHYKNLLKDGLRMLSVPSEFRSKPRITADYGLQGNRPGSTGIPEVEQFAADFIFNFMGDLEFYLKRVPKLGKEMLKNL